MRSRNLALSCMLTTLCIAFAAPAAHAQQSVKIIVGGIDKVVYLPAELTQRLGYFKDEGLDVELDSVTTGSTSEAALLSGSVQAVVGAYEQTIHLQAKGKYATSIVQLSATPQEVLLVSSKLPDVKSPADLKGKVLGVTGFGSLTYYLCQDLMVRSGLKASDAHFIAAGAGNTFISTMREGEIDAGMTTEPTVSLLVKQKVANVLVNLETPANVRQALGGDYPGSALYVTADWLKANPDTAKKLAAAFVRTLKYINTHTAEEIAAQMPPAYYQGDKDLYVSAIANNRLSFTPDGKMPSDGPKTILDILSKFGTGIDTSKIDLSKTYTNQLVE